MDGPPGPDGVATKVEYRVWNPFRSKLAAAILGGAFSAFSLFEMLDVYRLVMGLIYVLRLILGGPCAHPHIRKAAKRHPYPCLTATLTPENRC